MGQASRGKRKLAAALALQKEALKTTFQLLDEPAASSLDRVPWIDVKRAAEQVYKHATMTGMLWCGSPTFEQAEEKMETYVNDLVGFILLCHGSTVGAGPTLLAAVKEVAEGVLQTSLVLLEKTLEIKSEASRKDEIPPITGRVWEACEAVNKAPSENRTAVGRAIVRIGTSVKDVLRELGEAELEDEPENEEAEAEDEDVDENDVLDLGNIKFSKSELELAGNCERFVAAVLDVIREVLTVVTKAPESETSLGHLESLLGLCKSIGLDVDELGASTYPPQEFEELKQRSGNVVATMEGIARDAASLFCDDRELFAGLVSQIDRTKRCCSDLEAEIVKRRMEDLSLKELTGAVVAGQLRDSCV